MTSNTFSKSVLIVEDDLDLSSIYKGVFQKIGYNAIAFTDPILAFEHFESNPFFYNLIFTDLRMPGMSGIDLAKKIRYIRNDIMIWLCTAFMVDDLFSDSNFKSAKFDLVLEKPITLSRLKQIIETNLTPGLQSG